MQKDRLNKCRLLFFTLLALLLFLPIRTPYAQPGWCNYHTANNLFLQLPPFPGGFGWESPYPECQLGLIYPQFPGSIYWDYLFLGGFWIGAVVESETVVVGSVRRCDIGYGFQTTTYLHGISFPGAQVWHTAYFDSTRWIGVDQKSYAFYNDPYKDFIIFDLQIANVSTNTYEQVYLGVYFDGLGWVTLEDLCGSRAIVEPAGDTAIIGWVADNDGDPEDGSFTEKSATSVVGVKILNPRAGDCQTSFNWWANKWGPTLQSNFSQFGLFADSGIGVPSTCREKYYVMSNGEIDYEQYLTHLDHTAEGWLGPPQNGLDIAQGYPSVFLLSCGPVSNFYPNDTLQFSFAILGGMNFHTSPVLYDSSYPELVFYDFSTIVTHALTAQRLYDSLFNPPTDVDEEPLPIPKQFRLEQNYPNPFNLSTTIEYTLPKRAEVRIEVYNLLGQLVKTFDLGNQLPARRSVAWDGKNDSGEEVASGVYFYRLQAGDFVQTRKMTFLK